MITLLALLASSATLDEEYWEPTKLPSWAFSASIREQTGEPTFLEAERATSAAELSANFAGETGIRLGAVLRDPPAHSIRTGTELLAFTRESNGLARVAVTKLVPNGLEVVGVGCQTTARHSQPEAQFRNWLTVFKSRYGKPRSVDLIDGERGSKHSSSHVMARWHWVQPNNKNVVLVCYYGLPTMSVYVDRYVENGVQKTKTYRTELPGKSMVWVSELALSAEMVTSMYEAASKTNPPKTTISGS